MSTLEAVYDADCGNRVTFVILMGAALLGM